MESEIPLITLDTPFDFSDEMARLFFSSEQFSADYTFESRSVTQSRTVYEIHSKRLNRLGEIILVKFGEEQTKVFLKYEPYPTQIVNEYMVALWSQTHTAIDSSTAKIDTTPKLEAEIERKIKTIADKYRYQYEMRVRDLSEVLRLYMESFADSANTTLKKNPFDDIQHEVREFKLYIERQSYKDIYVDGKPQENIARALLQAFLTLRSYREVEVRGGRSDLLLPVKQGRFLFETKIWRGPDYYEQGIREIEEYIIGEDSDRNLLGIFYIVFDPTKSKKATAYIGKTSTLQSIGNRDVNLVIVDIAPPQPSRKL